MYDVRVVIPSATVTADLSREEFRAEMSAALAAGPNLPGRWRLFDAVFNGELLEAWLRGRGRQSATAESIQRLRLQLPDELLGVPRELLTVGSEFLATTANVPVSRSVASAPPRTSPSAWREQWPSAD